MLDFVSSSGKMSGIEDAPTNVCNELRRYAR
jgi:hypothetical protein